jgi:2-dehydro-3-deoxyphosphogluconate aldolase / (4S)-4-hydroxy-2-oxoglutarate aldolase
VRPALDERRRRVAGLGRVVAVLRADRPDHVSATVATLVAAGVPSLEITATTPGHEELIAAAAAAYDVPVGAGTVLDAATAERALAAGARFLVTPTVEPDVVAVANAAGVAVLCGAFSPTEVRAAWEAGADAVKVFPARIGGPAYLGDLLAPFPDLLLVPSGGVGPADAADYLRAGAAAVAVGGSVLTPALRDGDQATTRRRVDALLAAIG